MTLLAADIGNSHTVARAARRRRGRSTHWRVATDERRTADEWAVLLRGPARRRRVDDGRRDRGLRDRAGGAARVARHAARATSATCRSVVVEPGVRTGVPVLMDNPREVGTDRIVNALAAVHAVRRARRSSSTSAPRPPSTWSARKGEYVGGAIAPGIEISLEALGRRGAQLRKVELLAAAVGDRQEHRRGAAVRAWSSASPARSTGSWRG